MGLFSKKQEAFNCCGMPFSSKEELEQHQKKVHGKK